MAREKVGTFGLVLSLLLILSCAARAQQQIQVIDYCATTSTVTIPSITDQDGDLLDDGMQTTLLNSFVPPVYQSASDSCPSGAPISGTPDGSCLHTDQYRFRLRKSLMSGRFGSRSGLSFIVLFFTALIAAP